MCDKEWAVRCFSTGAVPPATHRNRGQEPAEVVASLAAAMANATPRTPGATPRATETPVTGTNARKMVSRRAARETSARGGWKERADRGDGGEAEGSRVEETEEGSGCPPVAHLTYSEEERGEICGRRRSLAGRLAWLVPVLCASCPLIHPNRLLFSPLLSDLLSSP